MINYKFQKLERKQLRIPINPSSPKKGKEKVNYKCDLDVNFSGLPRALPSELEPEMAPATPLALVPSSSLQWCRCSLEGQTLWIPSFVCSSSFLTEFHLTCIRMQMLAPLLYLINDGTKENSRDQFSCGVESSFTFLEQQKGKEYE